MIFPKKAPVRIRKGVMKGPLGCATIYYVKENVQNDILQLAERTENSILDTKPTHT